MSALRRSNRFHLPLRTKEPALRLGRALREGWIDDQQIWNLDLTASDLQSLQERKGELSLKDRFVLSVMQALESKDHRTVGIAGSHVLQMSSQNIAVMLKKMPDFVAHLHSMGDDEKRARLRELLDAVRERSTG